MLGAITKLTIIFILVLGNFNHFSAQEDLRKGRVCFALELSEEVQESSENHQNPPQSQILAYKESSHYPRIFLQGITKSSVLNRFILISLNSETKFSIQPTGPPQALF